MLHGAIQKIKMARFYGPRCRTLPSRSFTLLRDFFAPMSSNSFKNLFLVQTYVQRHNKISHGRRYNRLKVDVPTRFGLLFLRKR